ncbi:Na/Pi cotransporter family protein [Virgibacillus soli]|uniref:Na/Pi cotransporter family protein n=1 Tax=Paracerasibacillus soli TaxID=480284 RepID=A0ABU5CSQ2_9BACI|nr:Na/Pi cotransporter family protein [Virgibacillus soli]MDY0409417.1 Na/Pi cotransporter family protein [Virgibacillus soli]
MLTSILGFFGGLGIFLYGTHLLSEGLQKIGASRMRHYLATLTNTRWKGLVSGIVVTFFLQSSTVTNILIVGLVSGSIITLSQAFGIILGSAIGTTLTVQILTFNIAQFASVFIFLGAIFLIFIKRYTYHSIGMILLSIGFIFFGIGLISTSLQPVSENDSFLHYLVQLANKPYLFLLVAMFLTALMHSSAAMIMIGIAFITSGVLSLPEVLPLVLGANIGSTIPVVISSLSSRLEGKKVALFYFSFKTIGVIAIMLCLPLIASLVTALPGTTERQIAHFHTLYNIIIAIAFLPFIPAIARLFTRFFPKQEQSPSFTVHLDDALLEVPEEALFSSKREITRLAEMTQENMIQKISDYVDGNHAQEAIREVEQTIDLSYIQIQKYLLKLGQRHLTSEQSNLEVKLLHILNEIEHVGDAVIQFVGEAGKISTKNIILGERDVFQLKELIIHVEAAYAQSLLAFKNNDLKLARKNIQTQSSVNQFEKDIKFEHFNRLINKKEYNPAISAVYLDIVNQLLQIYHHSMNISRTVLGLI